MRRIAVLAFSTLFMAWVAVELQAEEARFKAYPAGIAHLEVESHIDVVFRSAPPDPLKPCSDPSNQPCETLVMRGTLTVLRQGPEPSDEVGKFEIRQEVIMAETRGRSSVLGKDLVLRQSATRRTLGKTIQKSAGSDFPADSSFEVFIEISALNDGGFPTVSNTEPIRVSGVITQIPPIGTPFAHKPGVATPLRDGNGQILAWTMLGKKDPKAVISQMPLIKAPGLEE